MANDGLLAGVRVLDLASDYTMVAGRMLADMGADVVKVEPPTGDPARDLGPFWHDQPDPQKSLVWFAYNAGKRGITLNLGTEDGRTLLRALAATADILVESFPPGYLDGLGLGYSALEAVNPRLIHVSVTAFGQEGPYAKWQGSDLVAMAMGGFMYTHGDPDRRPVSYSVPQAYLFAGAEAAAAAVMALTHRRQTGRGQHVDVSAQEAALWTLQNAAWFWDLNRVNLGRSGAVRRRADGVTLRILWPCKEGYILFPGQRQFAGMARWLAEEGLLPKELCGRDFSNLDAQHSPQEELALLAAPMERFFRGRLAWEVYEGAVKQRIMMMPVASIEQVARYRQLAERGYWTEVEHPELGERITYPGTFLRSTECPPRLRGRAPLIGEHNVEVYCGELGLSRAQLVALKACGAV